MQSKVIIFLLQLRSYSVNHCTSVDGMRMETNLYGDGMEVLRGLVRMEVKLDGDGWGWI